MSRNKITNNKWIKFKNFIAGWGLMFPTLLFLTLCLWRPTIIGGIYSFFKLQGFKPVEFVGFDNFVKVLHDENFLIALVNSIKFKVLSLILGLQ